MIQIGTFEDENKNVYVRVYYANGTISDQPVLGMTIDEVYGQLDYLEQVIYDAAEIALDGKIKEGEYS